MSIIDRGFSIDVFYRFSVHLAKRFQGEDFLELEASPLNPFTQMNRNLVGSILGGPLWHSV
jgi:hypothetical protein